jgi:hypothetical protein
MGEQPAFTRSGIVAAEGDTKWYEGAGVLESAMGIKDGFTQGDWFSFGANGTSLGLSALGAMMDPFQAVFAAGVGWLMEHLSILREPLDWLAGDPKEIEGHAATWRNIQQRVFDATEYYVAEVNRSTAAWTSQAAAAYRSRAGQHAEAVRALGEISDVLAEMTLVAGAMVGVVRNLVRDLIAEVVGAAISKALQALLVVTIPKILAEVALMVAEYSAKILGLLKRLVAVVGKLTGHLGKATVVLEGIGRSLSEARSGALMLGAYRAQAAGEAINGSRTGLAAYRHAHATIGQGTNAVYGPMDRLLIDTAKSALRNNGIQNSGSTADKMGDGDTPPPAIELPL